MKRLAPWNLLTVAVMLAVVFLREKYGNWLWLVFFAVLAIGYFMHSKDKNRKSPRNQDQQ
jgi:hypothetical protein